MITEEQLERVRGWFTGRLPEEWRAAPPEITVDRDEVVVMLHLPDVELAVDVSETELAEARAGRATAFREETRRARMSIAREAEQRYDRKVSWGVVLGDGDSARRELFTHVAAPVSRAREPTRSPGASAWSGSTRRTGSPSCVTRCRRSPTSAAAVPLPDLPRPGPQ